MVQMFIDQFAETLAVLGVRPIYCTAGDTLSGPAASLRRRSRIDWVHVRPDGSRNLAAANLRPSA